NRLRLAPLCFDDRTDRRRPDGRIRAGVGLHRVRHRCGNCSACHRAVRDRDQGAGARRGLAVTPSARAPTPLSPQHDPRQEIRLVRRSLLLDMLLLWLAGNALRLTILAVPPVIPSIHADLDLSATAVGVLGGLPVLLFAVAAVPGSLLIARLGPVRALVAGLLATAVFGALRGAVPAVAWLYATTILMGAGVAVMQSALPALVSQ